jgi:hypothetical protein
VLLDGIREDLTSPEVVAEIERQVRGALKQRRREDHGKRIAELQREVENLMDAIAAGQLRGSPALAKRLTAAETEFERLQVRQSIQPVTVPDVRRRFLAMVHRLNEVLAAEPERGRAALREPGERITFPVASCGLSIRWE